MSAQYSLRHFLLVPLFQFSLGCADPQEEPPIPEEISCDGIDVDNDGILTPSDLSNELDGTLMIHFQITGDNPRCIKTQITQAAFTYSLGISGWDNQGIEWSTGDSRISAWAYLTDDNDDNSKDRLNFSIYPSVDEDGNYITGDALVASIGMHPTLSDSYDVASALPSDFNLTQIDRQSDHLDIFSGYLAIENISLGTQQTGSDLYDWDSGFEILGLAFREVNNDEG